MDESLFTSEADRGSAALRRLAYTWASDADDLDDLVQMSWLLAWEKRATYRGDGDFVGWLLAIGRTVCTREQKKRRRERTEPLSDEIRDFAEADHVGERRARARDQRDDELLNIVMRLPERQRALILWHHMFGGSVKEMAKGIGRSTETVKATLAQARKKLSELTDEYRKMRGGGVTHLETTRPHKGQGGREPRLLLRRSVSQRSAANRLSEHRVEAAHVGHSPDQSDVALLSERPRTQS